MFSRNKMILGTQKMLQLSLLCFAVKKTLVEASKLRYVEGDTATQLGGFRHRAKQIHIERQAFNKGRPYIYRGVKFTEAMPKGYSKPTKDIPISVLSKNGYGYNKLGWAIYRPCPQKMANGKECGKFIETKNYCNSCWNHIRKNERIRRNPFPSTAVDFYEEECLKTFPFWRKEVEKEVQNYWQPNQKVRVTLGSKYSNDGKTQKEPIRFLEGVIEEYHQSESDESLSWVEIKFDADIPNGKFEVGCLAVEIVSDDPDVRANANEHLECTRLDFRKFYLLGQIKELEKEIAKAESDIKTKKPRKTKKGLFDTREQLKATHKLIKARNELIITKIQERLKEIESLIAKRATRDQRYITSAAASPSTSDGSSTPFDDRVDEEKSSDNDFNKFRDELLSIVSDDSVVSKPAKTVPRARRQTTGSTCTEHTEDADDGGAFYRNVAGNSVPSDADLLGNIAGLTLYAEQEGSSEHSDDNTKVPIVETPVHTPDLPGSCDGRRRMMTAFRLLKAAE